MAYHTLKILEDDATGVTKAQRVSFLYVDGYGFGDRLLEGVPFRISIKDGEVRAKMLLDEEIRRDLRIHRGEAERDAVDYAKETDVFSTTQKMNDDEGVLYDDTKPLNAQAFVAADTFEIIE